MIDSNGFRLNVGIILVNDVGRVFWARRIGQNAWQFPQGGMQPEETPEHALYRELTEEVGLFAEDVEIMGCRRHWLKYRLPKHLIRFDSKPICIGQKQKWFMLKLLADEEKIRLNLGEAPEFDNWRWVNYWYPLRRVIAFKRQVYRQALEEFAPLVMHTEQL
ncbi:RNA pyrophosphohydrolase [soil metagenome]